MKKKLLLTLLIVSVLICVFAISISAVTYTYNDADGNMLFSFDYETTATDYGKTTNAFIASNKQGTGFAKVDDQGNELTWYITNTQTDDAGNKTFTVASLKTVGEAGTINENGAYNFTSPVTNKNTVSVNFPDNAGIKTWGFKSFGGYGSYFNNNILFVYCPNTLTAFENNPFQKTPVMVVELEFETPVNNIPQNFAHEARNLTSINIPASVTIINGNGTNSGTPFYRNYSLSNVNFASNSVLTTIKTNAFAECTSLTSLVLPNSVTTIESRAFATCKNLTTIKLGASLIETTGWSVFHTCNNLTVYYIPRTLKTVAQHTFTHDGNDPDPTYGVFFYDGTKEELDALVEIAVASKNNDRLTNQYKASDISNIIEWDPSKPDSYYIDMATNQNKKFYIYNYNTCDAFYNSIHDIKIEGDNKCSGVCANCGLTEILENPVHTSNWIFNNGGSVSLVAQITAEYKCVYCPTVEETKTIDAIFTSTGYSYEMNGNEYTGIYQRTSVDKEALALYAELTGNKDSYNFGVVAGLAADANDNPIDGNLITAINGEANLANETTVIGTFLNTEYTIMEIKVTGVTRASQLYCGAFIVTGNDVTYLCGTTQNNVATKATFPQ